MLISVEIYEKIYNELEVNIKNIIINIIYKIWLPVLALEPSMVKTAGSPHWAWAKPFPVKTT